MTETDRLFDDLNNASDDDGKGYLLSLCDAAGHEIERLRRLIPRWISVSERLPEPGRVWTYCDRNEWACEMDWTGKYWYSSDQPVETPTHWMSLPEPPCP
jgi:hypothetical protein